MEWNRCTCVDEHVGEEFDLKALLFVTINDWPALSNLQDRQTRDTEDARTVWMILTVYIWRVVGRMCTWDIVDFFRAGIP